MTYEYHKEISRTGCFILVLGENGFMIWTHKNGRLKQPISEGYSHLGDAMRRFREIENGEGNPYGSV